MLACPPHPELVLLFCPLSARFPSELCRRSSLCQWRIWSLWPQLHFSILDVMANPGAEQVHQGRGASRQGRVLVPCPATPGPDAELHWSIMPRGWTLGMLSSLCPFSFQCFAQFPRAEEARVSKKVHGEGRGETLLSMGKLTPLGGAGKGGIAALSQGRTRRPEKHMTRWLLIGWLFSVGKGQLISLHRT